MITSTQNPKIKQVRQLMADPKARREMRAFVAEGVRLIEDALRCAWPFNYVLYSDDLNERGLSLVNNLRSERIAMEPVSDKLMQAISGTDTSQGILAVMELSLLPIPETLDFLLIPDRVRDPGNLGALIRTAEAAGVQAVFIPGETTDPFAPKVVRSGMGAHFRLPICPMPWERIVIELGSRARSGHPGEDATGKEVFKICLADLQGTPFWNVDFKKPVALIIGGEAEGASEQAGRLADERISIPMSGGTESLNAATAGAILMFEVVRQRKPIP